MSFIRNGVRKKIEKLITPCINQTLKSVWNSLSEFEKKNNFDNSFDVFCIKVRNNLYK